MRAWIAAVPALLMALAAPGARAAPAPEGCTPQRLAELAIELVETLPPRDAVGGRAADSPRSGHGGRTDSGDAGGCQTAAADRPGGLSPRRCRA